MDGGYRKGKEELQGWWPSKVSGSRRIRTRRRTMVLNWWMHDLSPFPLSLVINHCIKILALFLGTKVVAGGDGLCCAYLGEGKLNITCMRFPLQLLPRTPLCTFKSIPFSPDVVQAFHLISLLWTGGSTGGQERHDPFI